MSPYWPALSFKKPQVGDFLRDNYDPSCDFILYAGVGDPKKTKNRDWRKRLISILVMEPGECIRTEELVPLTSWKATKREHGQEWPWSFAVRQGWDCISHPWAHDVTPVAYRSLGFRNNRGGVVEVLESERQALLSIEIKWIELPKRKVVETTSARHDALRKMNREARVSSDALKRMAALITGRVGANPSYGIENLQITHLACNLAKNDGTTQDFKEWLSVTSDKQ